MDETATRAIIIGVAIFVTMIITTVIVFEFTTIKDLYKGVAETNISLQDSFDDLDKYKDSSNEFSGLMVKNAVKKYEDNDLVDVCLDTGTTETCDAEDIESKLSYKMKYNSTFQEIGNKYKIVFKVVY